MVYFATNRRLKSHKHGRGRCFLCLSVQSMTSWTRSSCVVVQVFFTSWANVFLLSSGKERTDRAIPRGTSSGSKEVHVVLLIKQTYHSSKWTREEVHDFLLIKQTQEASKRKKCTFCVFRSISGFLWSLLSLGLLHNLLFIFTTLLDFRIPLASVPAGSPSRGGDVAVYVFDVNQPSLPTSFLLLFFLLFYSCVYFCLYGPFNRISLHKF